jgi:hypothetical protein
MTRKRHWFPQYCGSVGCSRLPRKNLTISPLELFAEGMREQGHVKGRDFDLIVRTADGVLDRLRVAGYRGLGESSEINAPKMRCGSTKITRLLWPRVSESPQQYRHQMPVQGSYT